MENDYPSLILYTGKLPGIDEPTLKENLLGVQVVLFTEMGVISPVIHVQQDEGLPGGTFRLKINADMQESVVGLDTGEYWVFVTKDDFQNNMGDMAKEFSVRDSVEPTSGFPALIIKPSPVLERGVRETGQDVATIFRHSGVQLFDQIGYIVFCVTASLRRNLPELVTSGVTRYMLIKLELQAPALIKALNQEIDLEEITQGLKRQLAMHQPIRDLPLILEKMLVERTQERIV